MRCSAGAKEPLLYAPKRDELLGEGVWCSLKTGVVVFVVWSLKKKKVGFPQEEGEQTYSYLTISKLLHLLA